MIGSLLRALRRRTRAVLDLLVLAVLFTAIQPQLPPGHILAMDDLLAWTMTVLAAAALLRGRRLGQGPHRMLPERSTTGGAWMRAIAGAAMPWTLLAVYDLARGWSAAGIQLVVLTVGVVIIAGWLGRDEGRSAWNPGRKNELLPWLGAAVIAGATAVLLGNLDRGDAAAEVRWAARSALVGVAFLAVGLTHGRPRNEAQRSAAAVESVESGRRRRQGSGRSAQFRLVLALVGPGLGMWLLHLLVNRQVGVLDFSQAFVMTGFVLAWVGVLWDERRPVAVHCLLHEVVPAGGADKAGQASASSFERPPEGALRLRPLEVKRVRAVHPWLVPVRGTRIDAFDGLARPLWPSSGRPVAFHILGDAAFEPDAGGFVQTSRITLDLASRIDVNALAAGGAQSRRVVVMQAFPDPGERQDDAPTYRWDEKLRPGAVQVLDAATRSLTLTDGCIVVLSTEGVARAFELEIGEPVYDTLDLDRYRAPQLEDYSEVGG